MPNRSRNLRLSLIFLESAADLEKLNGVLNRLTFEDDELLITKFTKIRTMPVPENFGLVFSRQSIGKAHQQDSLGEVLTYVLAGTISDRFSEQVTSAKNQAILAFVKSLAKDTPIILFWF